MRSQTHYCASWVELPADGAPTGLSWYNNLHEFHRCHVNEVRNTHSRRYYAFERRPTWRGLEFVPGTLRQMSWEEVLAGKAVEIRQGKTITLAHGEIITAHYSLLPDARI